MAAAFDMCVCISLAELASMMPHSAGEPPPTPRSEGRNCLTQGNRSNLLDGSAGTEASSTSIELRCGMAYRCGLLLLDSRMLPDHIATNIWVGTSVSDYLYCSALALLLWKCCHRALCPCHQPPYLQVVSIHPQRPRRLYQCRVATVFVMIALLVRAHPKQSADFVFVDFVNYTRLELQGRRFSCSGYYSPGLTAVNGFDCAAHMAEEMPNLGRQVPQVMVLSATS